MEFNLTAINELKSFVRMLLVWLDRRAGIPVCDHVDGTNIEAQSLVLQILSQNDKIVGQKLRSCSIMQWD